VSKDEENWKEFDKECQKEINKFIESKKDHFKKKLKEDKKKGKLKKFALDICSTCGENIHPYKQNVHFQFIPRDLVAVVKIADEEFDMEREPLFRS